METIYNVDNWSPGRVYEIHDVVFHDSRYFYSLSRHSSITFQENINFGGFLQVNAVKLPNFLWKSSYSSQASFAPRVKSLIFGDNYEQKTRATIQNNPIEFSLVFDNRNDQEAKAILHFLKARKGVGSFFWTPYPPFSENRIFICPEWKNSRNFVNNNTITAKFIEQPYVVTLNSAPIVVPPIDPPPVDPPTDSFFKDLVVHWKLSEPGPLRRILPSNFTPKFDLTFFRMFNAVRQTNGMAYSTDRPVAFAGSSFCPNIGGVDAPAERWYHHPWGGEALNVEDSILINCGDLDFTHTGWFKLSSVGAIHIETIMPRGIFTIADNRTDAGVQVGSYQTGMELRCLTTYSTGQSVLEWSIWDQSATKQSLSISSLVANTWYFFVCGYEKTSKKIFLKLNAASMQYSSVLTSPPKPTNPIYANFALMYCRDNLAYLTGAGIQGYSIYKSAAPLQGYACSFSRWNRLLTNAEINILYKDGIGKEYPFFP